MLTWPQFFALWIPLLFSVVQIFDISPTSDDRNSSTSFLSHSGEASLRTISLSLSLRLDNCIPFLFSTSALITPLSSIIDSDRNGQKVAEEITTMDGSADNAGSLVDNTDDGESRSRSPPKSQDQMPNAGSSSSSSSSSSGEDFFQFTATDLTKPSTAEGESPLEAAANLPTEKTGNSPESSPRLLGLNQTPIEGYDPTRIPASVFARPKPSPKDWSTTSNESLFSIQMGNSSFSKDQAFLFSPSQEPTSAFRSGEMTFGRAAAEHAANAQTTKDALRSVAEEQVGAPLDGGLRSSGSSRSDASSIQSFAFPMQVQLPNCPSYFFLAL